MPSFTLKNIPEDLFARLRASAAEHRRSINQEALVRLGEALAVQRADPEALLRRADRLRRRLRIRPLTDRALREARDQGRP